MPLELACEVLWIVEAKTLSRFRDVCTAHQELLGTLHDESTDMRGWRVAGQFTHQVAKIVGRQEQLLGAVFHGGQPKLLLQAVFIVFPEQLLETGQQVGVG